MTDTLKTAHSEKTLVGSKTNINADPVSRANTQGRNVLLSDGDKYSISPIPSRPKGAGPAPVENPPHLLPKEEKSESPKIISTESITITAAPVNSGGAVNVSSTKEAIIAKKPEAKPLPPTTAVPILSEYKEEAKLTQKVAPQISPSGVKQVAHVRHGEIDSFDKELDISAEKITLNEGDKSLKEPIKDSSKDYGNRDLRKDSSKDSSGKEMHKDSSKDLQRDSSKDSQKEAAKLAKDEKKEEKRSISPAHSEENKETTTQFSNIVPPVSLSKETKKDAVIIPGLTPPTLQGPSSSSQSLVFFGLI